MVKHFANDEELIEALQFGDLHAAVEVLRIRRSVDTNRAIMLITRAFGPVLEQRILKLIEDTAESLGFQGKASDEHGREYRRFLRSFLSEIERQESDWKLGKNLIKDGQMNNEWRRRLRRTSLQELLSMSLVEYAWRRRRTISSKDVK